MSNLHLKNDLKRLANFCDNLDKFNNNPGWFSDKNFKSSKQRELMKIKKCICNRLAKLTTYVAKKVNIVYSILKKTYDNEREGQEENEKKRYVLIHCKEKITPSKI